MQMGNNIRMSRLTVLSAVLVVVIWSQLVANEIYAQTGNDALRFTQRFPGLTAENVGIGGVGYAGVRDGASMVLNPAGLGPASASTLSGSLAGSRAENSSVYSVADFSSKSTSDVSEFTLGNISYIYKAPTARGSLVFGVSFHEITSWERLLEFNGENSINSITDYYMPVAGEFEILEDDQGLFPEFSRTLSFIAFETFAIDFDQDLFNDGDPVPFLQAVRAGTVSQASRVRESGHMREFNFGAAYEAANGVFVGASLNIPYGTYTFARVFDEDDIFDDNNGENGTTDFDYLTHTDGFKSDMIGVNGRLGVIGFVSPEIRLGANVETPTSLSIEESFSTILETAFDNGDQFIYGGQIDDEGQGVFKYTLTTPWRIGVGAAYEGQRFMAMLDLEFIDWSSMRFKSSSILFSEVNSRIDQQLRSVVNGRLGLQYRLDKLALRAGLGISPDPHREATSTGVNPAVDQERNYFSLGLGYRFSPFIHADIGWMVEQYDEIYQPYTEVDGAPIVAEDHTRGRLLAGLTLVF